MENKDISKLIESREQGNCLDVPMREAAKQLLKEIMELEKRIALLNALEAAGVDNWIGYSEAIEMLEQG